MDEDTRHIDDFPGDDVPDAYQQPLGSGALPAYDPDAATPSKRVWRDEDDFEPKIG